jgi:ABC-2 type transport system permease protein
VLINPLVYASEGFRGALAPSFPHLPIPVTLSALCAFDLLFLVLGLHQFRKKAIG